MRSESVLLQDIDFSLENPRSQLERVCWTILCRLKFKAFFLHDCHAKQYYAALSDAGSLLLSLTVFSRGLCVPLKGSKKARLLIVSYCTGHDAGLTGAVCDAKAQPPLHYQDFSYKPCQAITWGLAKIRLKQAISCSHLSLRCCEF